MREVIVFEDKEAISRDVALRFIALSRLAGERFTVALAGGSTPKSLYELLSTEPYRSAIEWKRVLLFFGDERCVAPDDENSNYGMAKTALLDHISIPPENIFRMKGELDPDTAAQAYEAELRDAFGLEPGQIPTFDLVLLGMGPDGHTVSLFPGKASLEEKTRLVIASEPGLTPFVPRLTFTFPVLNAAKNTLFLVAGEDKRETLTQVLDLTHGDARFPSSLVNPTNGNNLWLVDREAKG